MGSSRDRQLGTMLELLRTPVTLAEIMARCGIGMRTAKRRLTEMRQQGISVQHLHGRYSLVQPDARLAFTRIHAAERRAEWIFDEIPSSGGIPFRTLLRRFSGSEDADGRKMSDKTFRKWLDVLIDSGRVLSLADGRLMRAGSPRQQMNLQECIRIIRFIRANLGPLPYDDRLQSLAGKLEGFVLEALNDASAGARDASEAPSGIGSIPDGKKLRRSVGASYRLHVDGPDYDLSDSQKERLNDLLPLVRTGRKVRLIQPDGSRTKPLHCLMVAGRIDRRRWDLVLADPDSTEAQTGSMQIHVQPCDESLHLEPVDSEGDPDQPLADRLSGRLEQARSLARARLSAGFSDEADIQPVHVELAVSRGRRTLEVLRERLAGLPLTMVGRTDEIVVVEAEVIGVDAFCQWIRGFGGKVRILAPKILADRQAEEARLLLENAERRERSGGASLCAERARER